MTPFSTRKTWSGSLFRPCSFKNVSKFVRSRPLNNTTASPCGGMSLFAFFPPKAIVVMTRVILRTAKPHIAFSIQPPYQCFPRLICAGKPFVFLAGMLGQQHPDGVNAERRPERRPHQGKKAENQPYRARPRPHLKHSPNQ